MLGPKLCGAGEESQGTDLARARTDFSVSSPVGSKFPSGFLWPSSSLDTLHLVKRVKRFTNQ